jgi:hypothetical protein
MARLKKKVFESYNCVLIFSIILCQIFLLLRRTERDTIKHVRNEQMLEELKRNSEDENQIGCNMLQE